jgi:hypothetical protein
MQHADRNKKCIQSFGEEMKMGLRESDCEHWMDLLGGKRRRPALKAHTLTAICKPTV